MPAFIFSSSILKLNNKCSSSSSSFLCSNNHFSSLNHEVPRTHGRRSNWMVIMTSQFPPDKIAIVGAGISGLSTALGLIRISNIPPSCITIYDGRETLDKDQGGAFNLSGASSLLKNEMGVDLRPYANPMEKIISRSTISNTTLFEFGVKQLIESDQIPQLIGNDDNKSMLVTIMRDELQKILSVELINEQCQILRGKEYKVLELKRDGVLCFSNNVELKYDLVIGADGINSIVRNSINLQQTIKKKYTGFKLYWGVDSKKESNKTRLNYGEIHQWLGKGIYVLHYAGGKSNSEQIPMIAISFREQSNRSTENFNYVSSDDDMIKDAIEKLKSSNMPKYLIDEFQNSKRFINTPIFEYETNNWSSFDYKCVCVGDSAHAMSPFLGQGANQAVQDAYVLSKTIQSNDYDLWKSIREYESIRQAPTRTIMKSSAFVGTLETQQNMLGTFIRDNLFKFLFKLGILQRTFLLSCIPKVGKY